MLGCTPVIRILVEKNCLDGILMLFTRHGLLAVWFLPCLISLSYPHHKAGFSKPLDESGVPRFFSPAPSFSSLIVTLSILNVTGLVFGSLCSYLFLMPSDDCLIIWPGIYQHLHVEWIFVLNVENGTIYLQEQQSKTGEVKVFL